MKINCCFKCEDRKIGCHASCEKYKEFQVKNDKERLERRNYFQLSNYETNWSYTKGRKKDGR